MYYLGIKNLTRCIALIFSLTGKLKCCDNLPIGNCFQSRRMRRERVFGNGNEDAIDYLFDSSAYNEKYRRVTLPKKVTAFFLTFCGGERIIPLESNDRIYVIDDKFGFPLGLAGCAIELRKKNIWVVQSQSRAARKARVKHIVTQPVSCDSCEITRCMKVHDNLVLNTLPNTRAELKKTFRANAPTSPFCALMASHPELTQRCVREGFYYSGFLVPTVSCALVTKMESVTCVFCESQTYFTPCESKRLTDLQRNGYEGWCAVEAELKEKITHSYGCHFREHLNDDVRLEVSDQAGNIIPTQSYFIADPALESSGNVDDSGKSCTYTRVFVMTDISKQERHQLFIPHDQINTIIRQQHLDTLCTQTYERVGALTTALQGFAQMSQELPSRYQQLYDNSDLNRAITSYRNKLQRLPSPRTQVQQEVLDFLADADDPLRAFYATSKQLTHLLPLTRCANAGVLTILTPKISELVAQYQQAIHAVYGRIDITNLTTLVPYELWSDCALREIGVVGNEVLVYLNRLTIDDNKLDQALVANQMKND